MIEGSARLTPRRWRSSLAAAIVVLAPTLFITAQPATAPSSPSYRLFIDPLPIYRYWYWLLLPLCILFSVVYKAVKCESMKDVPRQAISITFWILLGMASAAVGLALVLKFLQ